MSRLRKILILSAVICFAAGGLVAVSYEHWWLKNVGSRIFVNETYSEHDTVFRNSYGDFLISIDNELYVYCSSTKQLGIPNSNQFIFLGLFAYNIDVPVPTVLSSNRIKIEREMNVSEDKEWLIFTAPDGRMIKLVVNRN